MLAKVFKSQSAETFVPFSIPDIGDHAPRAENNSRFVFPNASDFNSVTETPGEFFAAPTVEDVLQNAREEAAQIVAQAQQHSAMLEQAAREKAMTDARQILESENAGQFSELRGELVNTIRQISGLSEEITNRVETDVVELALSIAKKIVGREVMFDRDIALTLVKISLKKLHSRAVAQIRLHPEDFQYVQNHREKIDFHGSLEFIEDRTISPGGCLIHTETGDVDARIESQFEEIAHGLLGKG